MKKTSILILVVFGCLSCINSKKRKISNEISDLIDIKNEQLEKVQQIVEKETLFNNQIKSLKIEVKAIMEFENVSSFKSIKNTAVIFKLKLIQEKLAYLEKLKNVKLSTKGAFNVTDYSILNYQDRLAVYEILSEKDIEDILQGIKKVKNEYLPETKNLELNITEEEKLPLESVWNGIFKKEKENFKAEYKSNLKLDKGLVSIKIRNIANLRNEPSILSKVVLKIPVGEEVFIIGYKNSYWKIKYKNKIGYLMEDVYFKSTPSMHQFE